MEWVYQRPATEEVSPPIATFTNPNMTQTRRASVCVCAVDEDGEVVDVRGCFGVGGCIALGRS